MEYEELLKMADAEGLIAKEKKLQGSKGRIQNNRIAIQKGLPTVEKACVLAEELGHYYTSVGNILDPNSTSNQKQELRARLWSYNMLIGLDGIIEAHKHHCENCYDMAEFLDVTEELLIDSLARYKEIYGVCTIYNNEYIIFFEPLGVMKIWK